MFEVGFTEIVLILGLALLVLGPEKLPALAEKIGRWTGRARAMARQLRTQLEHEVTLEELARTKKAQNSSKDSATASSAPPYASTAAPPQQHTEGESPSTPPPAEAAASSSDTSTTNPTP